MYAYDINQEQLTKILNFGKLPFNQKIDHIALRKDQLVFSLSPLMGWQRLKNTIAIAPIKLSIMSSLVFINTTSHKKSLPDFESMAFIPSYRQMKTKLYF